jgi:hypothetical protein
MPPLFSIKADKKQTELLKKVKANIAVYRQDPCRKTWLRRLYSLKSYFNYAGEYEIGKVYGVLLQKYNDYSTLLLPEDEAAIYEWENVVAEEGYPTLRNEGLV